MLLQAMRVGAVYPITFSGFGESGPAKNRATMARLLMAERRAKPQRLGAARAGADALIAQGLLGVGQARLLDGIGKYSAAADASQTEALEAFVALGITALARHFDPGSDAMAKIWLGGLRQLHQQGRQAQPLRHLKR